MKKSFKSGLALLLAVLMVLTTCLFSEDGFLKATDGDTLQSEGQSAADDPSYDATKVDKEAENVISEQGVADEESAQVAASAEAENSRYAPEQKTDENQTSDKDKPVKADADKHDNATAKEITYYVEIAEPSNVGGEVYVWTDGSVKEAVVYSCGRYVKSVNDGDAFNMQIIVKDGYKVDKVKANGNSIDATAVSGNVYTYKLNVNANKKLSISYKKTSTDTKTQNDANKDEDSNDSEDSNADLDKPTVNEEQKTEEQKTGSEDVDNAGNTEENDDEQADANGILENIADNILDGAVSPLATPVLMTIGTISGMPAQTLTATASDGATITIGAPLGAFENGAEVKVSPVPASSVKDAVEAIGGETDSIAAYDITIVDKDGNEIQPNKAVSVNINGADLNSEAKAVYHMADNGTIEEVAATTSGADASFKADSFSIYVVTGSSSVKVNGTKTIEVDETITLSSKKGNGEEYYSTTNNKWEIEPRDSDVVILANKNTNSVSVTGNQPGTVTLKHSFEYRNSEYDRKPTQNTESITVIVNEKKSSDQADANGIIAHVVTSSDNSTYGLNGLKIRYEDTNGTDITLGSGAISQFAFGNTIKVNKSTFAQPVGVIDGYVFENAYFYWSGHYSGTKYYASEFYNFGEKVTHYDSYIGFKCSNTSQATDRDGYFAYNPTGVLHLVYKEVSQNNPYKIYYMNEGEVYDSPSASSFWSNEEGEYVYKFNATEKNDPTRAGYVFVGWNTKPDGSGDWVQDIYKDGETTITSDVYLYAIYEDNEETYETPVYVYMRIIDESGKTLSPDELADRGYPDLTLNNAKWFTVGMIEDVNIPPAASVASITDEYKNTAVTALKDIQRYKENGKTVNECLEPNSAEISWNLIISDKGADNYVGGGYTWHLDGTLEISSLRNYTVKYLEEGTNKPLAGNKTGTAIINTDVTEESIDIDGYTVVGDNNKKIEIKNDPEENVITFYYKANPAEIVFEENGGTEVDDITGVTGEVITDQTLPTTTKTGYTFAGWYVNENLTGSRVTELPSTLPTGTTTYYAKWSADFSGITANGINKIYNGEISYVGVNNALQTDTIQYYVDGEEITNEFKDVTSKEVDVKVTRGSEVYIIEGVSVDITRRPVNITSANLTKTYDREVLVNGETDLVENSGWVIGEGVDVNFTGSQIFAGESANSFEISAWSNTNLDNYSITKTEGTLKVTDVGVLPDNVVKKTHNKNQKYAPGDSITFTITVKNIYAVDKDITIEEQSGVTIVDGATRTDVKPGDGAKFTATYVVTEQDIINGTFTNKVKAIFSDVDKKFINTDEVTAFVEPNPHITITKTTPDDEEGKVYNIGETINYKITVENDGNLTLTNVVVNDQLTGNTGEQAFKIKGEFAPGDVETFTASYKVTEQDIKTGGKIKNIAVGTGESKMKDENNKPVPPKVVPGEKEDNIAQKKPSFTVSKIADKTAGVKVGDNITYTITVTNNGNVSISNIQVTDELVGLKGNDVWKIENLTPGNSEQFTAQYTLTEKDILRGFVTNVATATGNDPDGKEVKPDAGKTTTDTDSIDAAYTVNKSIVGDKSKYKVGDTIKYEIEVKNNGNVTLNNIVVTDQLTEASGKVIFTDLGGDANKLNADNTVTIPKLAPGATVTLKCKYLVVRADAGKSIINMAIAKSDNVVPDLDNPNSEPIDLEDFADSSDPASVEKLYNLTIHYVYANGKTAAKDYTGRYLEGEPYGPIYSLTISGYTPDYAFIRSDKDGMLPEDVEITVVYTAIPAVTPTHDGGDGGNPGDGNTPAAPAAATTGVAVQANDNGGVELVPVVDDKAPLTKRDLADHDCCILHFLLILLALIVLICYTSDMKRRQARIAELKDELETEQIRRGGLGR